jgi:hypothetical protein
MQGSMYNGPTFAHDWTPQNKTFAEVFLWFFLPTTFLEGTVFAATNDALSGENSSPATLGEFLCYIRLWLLMACYMGHSPEDYWAPKVSTGNVSEDKMNDTPPMNFHKYMSRKRFVALTTVLHFTCMPSPCYRDKFWQIHNTICAWNKNVQSFFVAASVLCLDKSMSIWHNQWTCPGWVFCPRKPHPFGNEYHTV